MSGPKAEAAARAIILYRKELRQYADAELRWDLKRSSSDTTRVPLSEEMRRRGVSFDGPARCWRERKTPLGRRA